MDSIEDAIKLGKHLTENPILKKNTWKDFEDIIQKKKLILYGVTNAANILWLRLKINPCILAAIDNNSQKCGHLLNEFFDDNDLKDAKDITISSKSILKQYNPKEVVVLISSLSYYQEIAMELENKGFYCYFSLMNLEYNYRSYMKKNNLPYETLDNLIFNYIKQPLQKDKLVFYNARASGYSDHGKYIIEQILLIRKDLDIVWIVPNTNIDVPKGVRVVCLKKWKNVIYEIETAKFWLFHDPAPSYIIKRKEQIYIQLKHWGSITLKKFYLDTPLIIDDNAAKNLKLHGSMIDYFITGSKFDEDSCRSGFNFNGTFLRFGSSRSDAMFSSEKYKKKGFSFFNLNYNEKYVLYAPTFRITKSQNKKSQFDFKNLLNFDMLLKALREKWNSNWKILIRLHPSVKNLSKQIDQYKFEYLIDVSDYDDSQELIAISDILISDYSSIMFEPAYVGKPVFLYAPDKDEYVKNEREFLIDYNALPFPIAMTNEELAENIKNFDENEYKQKVQAFLDKYGVHEDGHSSERTAKFILKLLSKEGEIHA